MLLCLPCCVSILLFSCAAEAFAATDEATVGARLAYCFFRRGDVPVIGIEDMVEALAVRVRSSGMAGLIEDVLPCRCFCHALEISEFMMGEGRGVMSAMAARYGEASMELVEAGD